MSLVAYAASSDEDSDSGEETIAVVVDQRKNVAASESQQNGQKISKSLNLPQPKHQISDDEDDEITGTANAVHDVLKINLPAPKKSQAGIIEESDDEFLHKKVQPSLVEKPKPAKPTARQPVKISIPSLSDFDNDDDVMQKGKLVSVGRNPQKSSSLLSMLPPPKFDAFFGKPKEKPDTTKSTSTNSTTVTKTTSLVPHAVANKMKAAAAAAAKSKPTEAAGAKKRGLAIDYNNSDESDNDDDDGGDFFSLNKEEKLPDVSAAEISAMVAKKANRMAEFSRSLNQTQNNAMEVDEYAAQPSSSHVPDRNEINMEALIGARAAKRARKDEIQFIDISQDQIATSHNEWQRNQLAAETQYQPTGRLNIGDPGAGTKKKHQITYLAYQAKANEAELQAMWATNRQSRRQTQSKYGF